MTSHVIAYRSKELLFGTHAFNFNCFLDDFNYVLTQIRCLSVLLCKQKLMFAKVTNIHQGSKNEQNLPKIVNNIPIFFCSGKKYNFMHFEKHFAFQNA